MTRQGVKILLLPNLSELLTLFQFIQELWLNGLAISNQDVRKSDECRSTSRHMHTNTNYSLMPWTFLFIHFIHFPPRSFTLCTAQSKSGYSRFTSNLCERNKSRCKRQQATTERDGSEKIAQQRGWMPHTFGTIKSGSVLAYVLLDECVRGLPYFRSFGKMNDNFASASYRCQLDGTARSVKLKLARKIVCTVVVVLLLLSLTVTRRIRAHTSPLAGH